MLVVLVALGDVGIDYKGRGNLTPGFPARFGALPQGRSWQEQIDCWR